MLLTKSDVTTTVFSTSKSRSEGILGVGGEEEKDRKA